MTAKDIVFNLKKLFGDATSPGQAFDAILAMRRDGVTWEQACQAVATHGRAQQVLDEREDSGPEEFECPGCHVSRTNRAYCINPHCPEWKPNPTTARIQREKHGIAPEFKNPKLSFGQYHGKTLLEVGRINPSYLTWLEQNAQADFWKEQARMAKFALDATAPASDDTSDTGYFGQSTGRS